MSLPPLLQNKAPHPRLFLRLTIARFSLYGVLLLVGLIYAFLLLIAGTGLWLPTFRLLLAIVLVALAFVDNAIRYESPAPAAQSDEAPPARPRQLLPPAIQSWLNYFQNHLALTAVLSLLAIFFAVSGLADRSPASEADTAISRVIPGILLVISFGLLVIERTIGFKTIRHWRYQQEYVGLTRVMLSLLLLLAGSLLLVTYSPMLTLWLIKLGCLLVLLVALEYFLHVLMVMATPLPQDTDPRFLTRSLLAAQYRWPLRPLAFVLDTLEQRFGIDLRQVQAFRLMGKTIVPVVCGLAVLGWLLSGLTQVPLHQRGIYERFGRPMAVLSPGLHAGLPWPFGRVRAVEFGAVHELRLSDEPEQKARNDVPDSAEGPAPQTSWRLWDSSHLTDQSQVIASQAADKQSFQIVNMDIRLIWRVGLRNEDALNSQYQAEDLPVLIRSIARQVLVAQFASKQLDELLNEQRASLSTTLNQQIQQRLTALHTGVELLSTRIEAIHPPAGAADAYHGVQAAQIAASARVARERGYAATVTNGARQNAETRENDAQAFAAENLSRAQAAAAQFAADSQAWQQAGQAFILERRYHILSQTLAHTPLLILDSHLQGTNEPVLDMRQYPALSDSTAPQKASKP
ncbi:protease modulator HflK [Kluyvera sp. EC_51]|uniref:protease modulator HflK n=1 Tax=Kluyvera sp. EC_51 TaxID=2584089 RepID=UPI001C706D75|nr:protease modulator HflK [Kluyvera sp. EC_51]